MPLHVYAAAPTRGRGPAEGSGPGSARACLRLVAVGSGFVATAVVQGFLRVSPAWALLLLPGYLAAGYLAAIASTVVVNLSWAKARPLLHPLRWARYAWEHDRFAARQAGVAFAEELVWRALPTYLLIELLELPTATLLLVSALFTLLHLPGHVIYPWELLELFVFSALLALAYFACRDLALVVALHLVRNVSRGFLLWVQCGSPRPCRRPARPELPRST